MSSLVPCAKIPNPMPQIASGIPLRFAATPTLFVSIDSKC